MIRGTGTISNYGSYISNCTLGQKPYKIPVNNLQDVQLFIDIGGQPDFAHVQLIHTCGPYAGTIETLFTTSYVIGQKPNDDWYGVFRHFEDTEFPLSCFVIGITLTFGLLDVIYFSEEYCIETTCNNLTLVKSCYGTLDNRLSYGCDGTYFGKHATENTPLGNPNVYYRHQIYLRDVEVTLKSIKNTFKQGRTRNFRTEKEKIYQFWAELIPEWYIDTIDAIFYRGEVLVGDTTYLVDGTSFEKLDECNKTWKPSATFKGSCYQSFSCEQNICLSTDDIDESAGAGQSPGSPGSPGSGGGRIIENFSVHNDLPDSTVDSVTPAFYAITTGAFPVSFGEVAIGISGDYSGVIVVNVTKIGTGRLKLIVNSLQQDCVNVSGSGAYNLNAVLLSANIVEIWLESGAC